MQGIGYVCLPSVPIVQALCARAMRVLKQSMEPWLRAKKKRPIAKLIVGGVARKRAQGWQGYRQGGAQSRSSLDKRQTITCLGT